MNELNLVGQKLIHESFGCGIITEHISNNSYDYIKVKFEDEKTRQFQYPDIVMSFAKFENNIQQTIAIKKYNNRITKEKLAKEEFKRQYELKQLKLLEEKQKLNKIKNKKLYIAKQKKRYEEKQLLEPIATWLVFQGKSFKEESENQYLFVEDTINSNCIEMPFWATIKELKINNVVLHCKGKFIYAISKVISTAYKTQINSKKEGFKVDCDYIILTNQLDLSNYREQIIEYNQEYMSPFNKYGKGNQGYLYPLDYDLAQFFIKEIIKINPSLTKYEYIKTIIETKL